MSVTWSWSSQNAAMGHYYIPRSLEDYPCAIDDDLYARENLQEIKGLHEHYIAEIDDDAIMRMSQDTDVCALASAMDYETQLFGDKDLYECTDEEYDYPRGIDDDEDSYVRDPELRGILEDSIFANSYDQREGDSEMFEEDYIHDQGSLEEGIVNTRYFDPTDLYDRGDPQTAAFHMGYANSEERNQSPYGFKTFSFDRAFQLQQEQLAIHLNKKHDIGLDERSWSSPGMGIFNTIWREGCVGGQES